MSVPTKAERLEAAWRAYRVVQAHAWQAYLDEVAAAKEAYEAALRAIEEEP